jgi:MbtH protein
MDDVTSGEDADYRVVRNDEDQYSIFPARQPNPEGWSDVGFQGTKARCLEHIEVVWTDLRPRSVRPGPQPS